MPEDATSVALKRVIAWQIAEEMKAQQITKTELPKRMHTSRAALNRLLDEADPSLTLTTLASAAAALGQKVTIQFANRALLAPHEKMPASKTKRAFYLLLAETEGFEPSIQV